MRDPQLNQHRYLVAYLCNKLKYEIEVFQTDWKLVHNDDGELVVALPCYNVLYK